MFQDMRNWLKRESTRELCDVCLRGCPTVPGGRPSENACSGRCKMNLFCSEFSNTRVSVAERFRNQLI